MAGKWVKSLQCKSRSVVDDVFIPLPKHQPLILPSAGCRNSLKVKDVVVGLKPNPNPNPKPPKCKSKSKPEPEPDNPVSAPISVSPGFFPSLSNLPEGHASRNVVEIIFRTRWASKSAFPGRVEMVFKVHNSGRTLTRFEECREAVKSRAGSGERSIRCVADGNEMMRFHCLGPTSSGVIDGAGGIWEINGGGKSPVPFGTFSGSGAAHDSAGGKKGRRAMLVCRVIAGRVGFDSVSGESNGELLVFDARAVLPCFVVIYKL